MSLYSTVQTARREKSPTERTRDLSMAAAPPGVGATVRSASPPENPRSPPHASSASAAAPRADASSAPPATSSGASNASASSRCRARHTRVAATVTATATATATAKVIAAQERRSRGAAASVTVVVTGVRVRAGGRTCSSGDARSAAPEARTARGRASGSGNSRSCIALSRSATLGWDEVRSDEMRCGDVVQARKRQRVCGLHLDRPCNASDAECARGGASGFRFW
jgi:hypothetical protein